MPSSLLILVLSCRFSDCFSNSDDAEGGESDDAARPPESCILNDGTPEWLTDLQRERIKLEKGTERTGMEGPRSKTQP